MKVEWTLKEMDWIKIKHIKANLEYWKIDLLFNATRMIERIEGSRFLNVMSKGSEQLKDMIFFAKNRAQMTEDDIDSMVNYKITEKGKDELVLQLYVNENYFSMNEMIEIKMGRRLAKIIAKKSSTRQGIIDGFETEIRETYTKNFAGKVIEDDGKNLSIYH
jgi:hypothetical protein